MFLQSLTRIKSALIKQLSRGCDLTLTAGKAKCLSSPPGELCCGATQIFASANNESIGCGAAHTKANNLPESHAV
jgi:hypothetical protein